jgi:hypothetical protein
MRHLLITIFTISWLAQSNLTAQVPAAISIQPADASAFDELTLTFSPAYSCEAGTPKSLAGSTSVRMHSGVTLNGLLWQNIVAFDQAGANGQATELTSNANGTYSIKLVPALFYGLDSADAVSQICCIFTDGPGWTKTGKDKEVATGICVDFYIGLATIGMEDVAGVKLAATAFPNPFNDAVTLAFTTSAMADLTFEIRNIAGQTLLTTSLGRCHPGYHEAVVQTGSIASGFYLGTLRAGNTGTSFKLFKQ